MANNKDEIVLIGPSSPAMERGLAALTVHMSLFNDRRVVFLRYHGDYRRKLFAAPRWKRFPAH
jgi:hypothetical protein